MFLEDDRQKQRKRQSWGIKTLSKAKTDVTLKRYEFQLIYQPQSSSQHMKREKLIALWWLANGANWFREQEMEK